MASHLGLYYLPMFHKKDARLKYLSKTRFKLCNYIQSQQSGSMEKSVQSRGFIGNRKTVKTQMRDTLYQLTVLPVRLFCLGMPIQKLTILVLTMPF